MSGFVVKRYLRNGTVEVSACDRYQYQAESPLQLRLYLRDSGWEVLDFDREDSIFIEAQNGRTITKLRPPRED